MHDYHIHSNFSTDSQMSMEAACEKAIDIGLTDIAFTDHVDFDYPNFDDSFMIDYHEYRIALQKVREKYQDKLTIAFGVEIGLQPHVHQETLNLLNEHPFDFIILSTHVIDHLDMHVGDFCAGKTREQSYERYLKEVYDSVSSFDKYSVYGHLDLIRRYGGYTDNFFRPGEFDDLLNSILKKIIESGHGIEINTSGFRYGLGTPMPTLDILKKYKELGGELITIGSDAHSPEYIGHGFDYALDMLRCAGFRYIANFKQLNPIYVPID
ncbi:MAG: histidinol-phosphatase HisJ family protein [Clostridiaceae bacterium]|nr:histidinol-phosphatase HisJ family protein [Clostridiaceae bacterium]